MDLYEVLSVTRTASSEEIERAYRRLARRYHPGVNPGDPVAEARFHDLQLAYGVLGDLDRRREYDRGGGVEAPAAKAAASVAFAGFDFSAPAEGPLAATFSELFADVFRDAARRATSPEPSPACDVTLRLSFEDAMRGGAFPVSVVRREACPACSGDGATPRPPMPCPACGGQGTQRWARGHMVFTKTCERCDGRGQVSVHACRTCGGTGVQTKHTVVPIGVPPGVENGARLFLPSADTSLSVVVEVAEHAFFRRHGRDLEVTVPIAVHEAALGAKVDVPTLERPVRVRIPPGTSSGTRLRVRGAGVPAATGRPEDAGDLVLDVQIALPSPIDGRSKALLEEFARLHPQEGLRRRLFEDARG